MTGMMRLCILLLGISMAMPSARGTPSEDLLASANRYCATVGGSLTTAPVQTGLEQIPKVSEEFSTVDYGVINRTIAQAVREEMLNFDPRVNLISPRPGRCCRRVTQLEEELGALKRRVNFLTSTSGWHEVSNGLFYFFVSSRKSWRSADADCKSKSARIASSGIRDPEIRRELIAHFGDNEIWIGLTDIVQEGAWVWQDEVQASTTDPLWASGEPNDNGSGEDCAYMFSESGTWKANDEPCQHTKRYLCEKSF